MAHYAFMTEHTAEIIADNGGWTHDTFEKLRPQERSLTAQCLPVPPEGACGERGRRLATGVPHPAARAPNRRLPGRHRAAALGARSGDRVARAVSDPRRQADRAVRLDGQCADGVQVVQVAAAFGQIAAELRRRLL